MNLGLVTSFALILGFFYISGSGFTIALLPSQWWIGGLRTRRAKVAGSIPGGGS